MAIEAVRLCIPVYESVQDTSAEAHSRLLHANALLQVHRAGVVDPSDPHGLDATPVVTELMRSQDLYASVGDKSGQAEAGRILDTIAADAVHADGITLAWPNWRLHGSESGASQYAMRTQRSPVPNRGPCGACSGAAARAVLQFANRHPNRGRRNRACQRRGGQRQLRRLRPDVERGTARTAIAAALRAHFAAISLGGMLLLYLVGYTVLGLGLISLSSPRALRNAQSAVIVMDDEGVWCEVSSRNQVPELQDDDLQIPCMTATVLPWRDIQEAYETNRRVVDCPLAAYSRLDLFGAGEWLTVPGQTVNYEGELGERIRQHLPVMPQHLGFSIFKSWAGPLLLLTLVLNVVLLTAGVREFGGVTRKIIGPYSLTDLYLYTYVFLLAPLGWLLVVNPMRATLVLAPRSRWPLWLGLAGLAFQAFFIAAPAAVSARMPLPRIYPNLIGAFLAVAGCVFVMAARDGARRPSERTTPVYSFPLRIAAAAVLLLSLTVATIYTGREVRAYHQVVVGNELRNRVPQGAIDPASRGVLTEAANHYRQAIELAPNASAVSAQLAAVLSALGQHQEALDQYKIALKYRPDRPTLYANYAAAFQQSVQGKPPNAITTTVALTDATNYFRYALAGDPNNTDWQLAMAMIFQQLKRFDEALGIYQQVLVREPSNPDALAGQGWASMQKGAAAQEERNKARAAITTLVGELDKIDRAKDPAAAEALSLRIAAATTDEETASNKSSGYYLAASQDFQKALALLPTAMNSRSGTATPSAGEAGDLNHKLANIEGGLGIVMLRLGQYLAAVQHFERAAALEPTNADYLISAGNVHWLIEGPQPNKDTKPVDRVRYERHLGLAIQEYIDALNSGLPLPRRSRSYLDRTLGQFYFLRASVPGREPVEEYITAIETHATAITLAPMDGAKDSERFSHNIASAMLTRLEKMDWVAARALYRRGISAIETARRAGARGIEDQLSRAHALYAWGLYSQDGSTDEAIKETLEAREIAPQGSEHELRALYNLGIMYLTAGDTPNAQPVFDRAAELVATEDAKFKDVVASASQRLQKLASDRPELSAFIQEVIPPSAP